MPFIARDGETNERIDITKIESPRSILSGRTFRCQLCNKKMFFRGSPNLKYHFYHASKCNSDFKSNPETPEHVAGKSYVSEKIFPLFNPYFEICPEYEVPVKEVMRVADVLADFPMGWRVAHEIQLSSITKDDLDSRTDDYLKAGIDVFWWFGKSADSPNSREWAIEKYGFSLCLIFTDEGISPGYWERRSVIVERYLETYIELESEFKKLIDKLSWMWMDLAFLRYFQVWEKGNNDLYRRAFKANEKTIRSFNGHTGAGNGKWFYRDKNGWRIKKDVFLTKMKTKKIPLLEDQAIENIRARAMARQKDQDNVAK